MAEPGVTLTPVEFNPFGESVGKPAPSDGMNAFVPVSRGTKISTELKSRKPVFAAEEPNSVTMTPVDFDPFAAPKQDSGVKASDVGKSFTAGAASGAGAIAQGGGELLARGINMVGERLGFDPQARAVNPLQGWINDLIDSRTPAAKKAEANTQISGELLKPETWEFGKDPSVSGFALQGMNALGQFAPNLGLALVTAGMSVPTQLAVGATVGGIQALGGSLDQEREQIKAMKHEDLLKGSKLYAELIAKGVPQATAKDAVAEAAAIGGGIGNAIPSAGEGAFENFLIGALTKGKLKIPSFGGGMAGRMAAGGAGGALMGGTEEAIEQAGQNVGSNVAIGGDRPIGQDTLQNFVMGALAEGAAGTGFGALPAGRQQAQSDAPPPAGAPAPTQSNVAPAPPTGPTAASEPTGTPAGPIEPDSLSVPGVSGWEYRKPIPQDQPNPNAGSQIPEVTTSPLEQARIDAANPGLIPTNDPARLRNAQLVAAYGENAAVKHVIESGEMDSVAEAMLRVAPTVQRMKATLSAAENTRDISSDILTALDELKRIKASGRKVSDVMAEGLPGEVSYEGQQLMAFLDANQGDPGRIAQFMEAYLQAVETMGGIPSQVRGKAFDILHERNVAKKQAEEAAARAAKERTEAKAQRGDVYQATEQHRAEMALTEIAKARGAGHGINPEYQSAMEIAFQNAKPLKAKPKGKPSGKQASKPAAPVEAPAARPVPASKSEPAGPSAGVSEKPASAAPGRVPVNPAPAAKVERPASTPRDQPRAQNRGREIAAEVNAPSIRQIHKLADRKGVKWDNDPAFMKWTKEVTGKEHLDALTPAERQKLHDALSERLSEKELQRRERLSEQKRAEQKIQRGDGLLAAIAKLGGMSQDGLKGWGIDPADVKGMRFSLLPVARAKGGLSPDAMAEKLSEIGFLTRDEHGKWDLAEFEQEFGNALRGEHGVKTAEDYEFEAQDLAAAGYDDLTPTEQAMALDVLEADETPGDWSTMTEEERNAELEAKFGPQEPAAQREGGSAQARPQETRPGEREPGQDDEEVARPALELSAPTPEELKARAEAVKAAEVERAREVAAKERAARDAANQKETARREAQVLKERADKAREEFQLGQEAPKKEVSTDEAAGQGDVFAGKTESKGAKIARELAESKKAAQAKRDAENAITERQAKELEEMQSGAVAMAEQATPQMRATVETVLTEPEKQETAKELGHKKWSRGTANKFLSGYAEWLHQGAKDLGTKLSSLYRKVLDAVRNGALAIAVAFNFNVAQYEKPLPLPVTTTTIRSAIVQPRADFKGVTASPDARLAADWIARSKENKPFIIADKPNGMLYAFSGDSVLLGKAPALFGKMKGDVLTTEQLNKSLEQTSEADKITPAGKFSGQLNPDKNYGRTVDFVKGQNATIAIHRVFLGNPKENRLERLASETTDDNRISSGCINAMPEFMEQVIWPNFEGASYVVVLPDSQPAATFLGITEPEQQFSETTYESAPKSAESVAFGGDTYGYERRAQQRNSGARRKTKQPPPPNPPSPPQQPTSGEEPSHPNRLPSSFNTPSNTQQQSIPQRQAANYRAVAGRIVDRLDRLLNPLGSLPQQREYLVSRYLAQGVIENANDAAKEIRDVFLKASEPAKQAIYDYLTTAGATTDAIPQALRAEATKVKEMIGKVGDQLVEKGLLAQESRDEYRDAYLPRLYLKHLLSEQDWKALGAGKKPSDMGYLKARKDIPEDVRKVILGEVTDPGFLSAIAVAKPLRDMALLDWLNTISVNENWVMPGAATEFTSTVTGKSMWVTPYWLQSEASRLRKQARYQTPEVAAKAETEAKEMDRVADAAIEEHRQIFDTPGSSLTGRAEDFKQIPNTARYGRMRGLFVRQEIYNDLMGAQDFLPNDPGWFQNIFGYGGNGTQATQIWKAMKVAMNPPSQIRNFVSNGVLLQLSGVPLRLVPARVIQAWRDILTDGKYYQIARKYGVGASTFSTQEVYRMKTELLDLEMKTRGMGALGRMHSLAALAMNKAGDFYQFSETVFKTAKIIDMMEREKASEQDAVLEAQKALFDYSLVQRSVRYARNAPIGIPFLTFQSKVLPRLIDVALHHPERFAPWAALFYGFPMLVASMLDVDKDDLEKLKQAMPEWLRDKGHALILPFKDDNGRWQVVDLGYFMPWTMWTEVGGNVASGDMGKALQTSGLFGGPVTDIITAMKTGKDPFTKRDIWQKGDPPAKQWAAIWNYVYNVAAPPILTDRGLISPNGLLDKAYGGKLVQAATGTTNKFGEPRSTAEQAMLYSLGLNVSAITPETSRAQNVQAMTREMQDVRTRMRQQLQDRGLSEAQRKEIATEYAQEILRRTTKLQKYLLDSAINPRLATAH